ncbi:hypothetical protein T484DRAFT_2173608 [Baffinella frigidus]|nr:hypothetical protein T484DRAFT_2173608 [Cryptophyta sp. CCMP2293]
MAVAADIDCLTVQSTLPVQKFYPVQTVYPTDSSPQTFSPHHSISLATNRDTPHPPYLRLLLVLNFVLNPPRLLLRRDPGTASYSYTNGADVASGRGVQEAQGDRSEEQEVDQGEPEGRVGGAECVARLRPHPAHAAGAARPAHPAHPARPGRPGLGGRDRERPRGDGPSSRPCGVARHPLLGRGHPGAHGLLDLSPETIKK